MSSTDYSQDLVRVITVTTTPFFDYNLTKWSLDVQNRTLTIFYLLLWNGAQRLSVREPGDKTSLQTGSSISVPKIKSYRWIITFPI